MPHLSTTPPWTSPCAPQTRRKQLLTVPPVSILRVIMDLLAAAAQGDTHTITSILNSKSVDVNFQNKVNGWTALHWACKRNEIPTVKLLLAHGAKNIKNFKDQTPLDVAQEPQELELLLKENDSSELLESVLNELSTASLEKILTRFDLVSKQDLLIRLKN